jgi:hypothetical protein
MTPLVDQVEKSKVVFSQTPSIHMQTPRTQMLMTHEQSHVQAQPNAQIKAGFMNMLNNRKPVAKPKEP